MVSLLWCIVIYAANRTISPCLCSSLTCRFLVPIERRNLLDGTKDGASSTGALSDPIPVTSTLDTANDPSTNVSDPSIAVEAPSNNVEPRKQRTKQRGMNKKRDFNYLYAKEEVDLCFRVALGEPCADPGHCRRSHDVAAYMASCGPAIGDHCPTYAATGYCRFGVRCRFYPHHTDGELNLIPSTLTEVCSLYWFVFLSFRFLTCVLFVLLSLYIFVPCIFIVLVSLLFFC